MKGMTKEALAKLLDGRIYQNEINDVEEELAYDSNLVVIFALSDDSSALRGAITDSFYCSGGARIRHKELPEPIRAVWHPEDKNCSWAYETIMSHAEFRIYDDSEVYCTGIIIDLDEVTEADMSELIDVTIALYFEVHNSEMWGGKGSVGYTRLCYKGCRKFDYRNINNDFLDRRIDEIANSTDVDRCNVRLISKQEYEDNTGDDEDE